MEDVCNELSADAIRADVMDNMFGSEINITPEEWRASIESEFLIFVLIFNIFRCYNRRKFE